MDNKHYIRLLHFVRWVLIIIIFTVTVTSALDLDNTIISLPISKAMLSLYILAACVLHGYERYGIKNITVFIFVTFVVAIFFEALSIRTGFPFGNYYYLNMPWIRILDVPVIITFMFFSMGYLSWTLAHIFTTQFGNIPKKHIYFIPAIAGLLMVMWDLAVEPVHVIYETWVWETEGMYFGAPLTNFFGWFLTPYVFCQLFAFYIAKKEVRVIRKKSYWIEAAVLFGIIGLEFVLLPFDVHDHRETFITVAYISLATTILLSVLSVVKIIRSKKLE